MVSWLHVSCAIMRHNIIVAGHGIAKLLTSWWPERREGKREKERETDTQGIPVNILTFQKGLCKHKWFWASATSVSC
jgi:hypothetical protein